MKPISMLNDFFTGISNGIFSIVDVFGVSEETPDKSWKKKHIKEYMDINLIDYNSGDTKLDLLEKIKIYW